MAFDLPEPHFVDRDPEVIRAECIAVFEAATEKPLLPSQVERLLIDLIVYRETLIRIAIQEAAKQNLPAYANYPMIDLIGQIVDALRLPAQAAFCNMLCELEGVLPYTLTLPAGFRRRTKDGKATFTLDADIVILPGVSSGVGRATCTAPGIVGNGYLPTQVSEVVDAPPVPMAFYNATETAGGAPSETTPSFRKRFPDAIASKSTAGPRRAYKAHAKAAHPSIVDVVVTNPAAGTVRLTVLVDTGVPSAPILDLVLEACDDEWTRPLTDTVQAVACTEVPYTIDVGITLKTGANASAVEAAVGLSLAAYAAEVRAGLGRLPVRSEVFKGASVGGVFEVLDGGGWTLPATIGPTEWANCTGIVVTVLGYQA